METKLRTLASIHANHFSAHLDAVRLRTGKTTERIRIEHPEAAAVLPFIDAERILMVRQWRYAVGRATLEIPAGKVDPEEGLETCAHRELLEETGYRASRLISLFRYHPAIGYSDEVIEIFAASGLDAHPGTLDVDEISHVETVPLAQAMDWIVDGTISDGKTVLGIFLFNERMKRGEIPASFFT
ncbi:NUDIX domain-containing protein [Desulfoglaeba alkanexedens]|jgi:ADP-ribose pyrophosphatase|uniref:GDP-mannose pyrophosphatase n=1 Tax=Desulfoglaeba alkanexedens ALDC TaxID=980445 RepID=A0A4P8KZN2_9BACT|nr:NUDIX hydrolase [Desulfoglaeba alkanexedens]QCQ20928.1 NUDIX hydrolase [Desulfoglaeba alkanexedens ALDC]